MAVWVLGAGDGVVKRGFAALVFMLFGLSALFSSAWAVVPQSSTWFGTGQYGNPMRSAGDALQACQLIANDYTAAQLGPGYIPLAISIANYPPPAGTNFVQCVMRRSSNNAEFYTQGITRGALACPANSTAAGGGNCTCNSGFAENAGHTACVVQVSANDEHCQGSAALKISRHISGKTGGSMPATVCFLTEPPFPGEEGKGCMMQLGDGVVIPLADGTRAYSADGRHMGSGCTPATDPVMGEPRPGSKEECAGGFTGTVNGVKKCVLAEPDKGIEGVKTTARTNADGSKDVIKEDTKCEGTTCTTTRTTTTTPAAGGTPTVTITGTTMSLAERCMRDKTNPICAATGTATAGTSAAGGGNGDGEGNCGGPDQPPCNVKVDETGVEPSAKPEGIATAEQKMAQAKTDSDELRDKIKGDADKGWLEPLRTMFWAPPIAACQAYDFPHNLGSLNPCGVVDGIRNVMAFCWAATGLFMCFGMVKRSI